MTNITKEDGYLSVSEFAKLAGLARKTLLYYDEIDLFSPAVVLENGYRYYYYRQLYTINTIKILKEIGMSLKDIKEFIKNQNPTIMISTFDQQQKIIEEKIKDLKTISSMIGMQKEMAMEAVNVKMGVVSEEYRDREPIFCESRKLYRRGEEVSLSMTVSKFYNDAKERGITHTYPWGVCVDYRNYMNDMTKNNFHFYYHVPESEEYMMEGNYIFVYTSGNREERQKAYWKLVEYAKEKNYILEDWAYEDYLINEISAKFPDDFIIKTLIRVI